MLRVWRRRWLATLASVCYGDSGEGYDVDGEDGDDNDDGDDAGGDDGDDG